MVDNRSDFDNPWKEAISLYFRPFMKFFFPQIEEEIDWERGYEFLDQEFQQVVREAETGKAYTDKLVKVWRKNGTEIWVLVHVEVQSQAQEEFPERMYIYNYRIYDRYRKPVVSLAILADESAAWRRQIYPLSLKPSCLLPPASCLLPSLCDNLGNQSGFSIIPLL